MVAWRARFPFTFVLMLGDNIYGTSTAHDYELKFERPTALLDQGVVFRAAIGNHDDPSQIHYQLFNMEGRILHLPGERAPPVRARRRRRAILRAGQPVVRSAAARLAAAADRVGDRVEDRLLPSPALHVGPLPRRRPRLGA